METNYQNAKGKLPLGFYHFFRFNKKGQSQAQNFLRNIKKKRSNLPLVIDVEEWGNQSNKPKDEVIHEIHNFIRYLQKQTKQKIIIYSNESSYNTYISGHFDTYDVWICSFSSQPKIKKKWLLWQHSHKGKFDGADGWIDINTFNGNRAEFTKALITAK